MIEEVWGNGNGIMDGICMGWWWVIDRLIESMNEEVRILFDQIKEEL